MSYVCGGEVEGGRRKRRERWRREEEERGGGKGGRGGRGERGDEEGEEEGGEGGGRLKKAGTAAGRGGGDLRREEQPLLCPFICWRPDSDSDSLFLFPVSLQSHTIHLLGLSAV